MRASGLVLVLWLLHFAGAGTAQSADATADPVSGRWTGDIGLSEAGRTPVTFDLTFDGSTSVSGSVTGPGPATFRSGTFDRATGTLKLEVDVGDGGALSRFSFEGIAVGGMATGRVNGNGQSGTFRLTRAGESRPAATQPDVDLAAGLRAAFAELSGWVTRSAELVPAGRYTFRPIDSVRTFGQLIAHIADASNYYCARASGQDVAWSDANANGPTDKATVMRVLQQSLATCTSAHDNASSIGPLFVNLNHTSLHYGNVITYLRMLGLVPPSSG